MEQEVARRNKRAMVQRAILASVAVAGVLAAAAIVPGASQILKVIDPKGRRLKNYFRNSAYRARDTLLAKGYMEFVNTSDSKKFRLTEEGKKYLRKLEGNEYKLEKPKKWDGQFRIVTFDIKEGRKKVREQLRDILRQIGFYPLQKSVWVYPYDCEELVTMLKADFKIGRDILYVIAARIEYDKPLRTHFNLPEPRT